MNLVFVITIQVGLSSLLHAYGHAATSPDFSAAMGPCGAPKACSQQQAVLWDQFCCFCSLCPLEEQGPGARPVSALLVRLWGFSSEPAQGIASF